MVKEAEKHSHHEKGECRSHITWAWGRGVAQMAPVTGTESETVP